MNRSIQSFCITVLMLSLFAVSYAQRFVNVTIDGVQTVSAITQDEKGVMWLGTDNGLYSYDGYHGYKHYAEHSISNTRVNALGFENKNLYMATVNGVLNFDTQSNLYVESPGSRKFQDAKKRKQLRELRVLDFEDKQDIYGTDVYALLKTPMGKMIGKISGLYLNNRLVPITEGKQPLVNALAYDAKRHCYWIGTEGALYCADGALKNFTRIDRLNGNSVKCLAEEENGMLYIGTDNGLFTLSMENIIHQYVHDSRDLSTIPNNIVWACYVDKWQNVWIGTDNGLSRLPTHPYYEYTSLDKITLSGDGNSLHAIYQSKNGDWWLGGTNGLIRKGSIWYKQNNSDYPLTHNRVRKVYEDRDGDIWVCTDHGINLFNAQTQQMMNFIVYDKSGKYSTTWAYDILQDKKGRMWMASYQGGIFVMDKSKLVAAIASQAKPTAWVAATCVADFHFSDHGKNALAGLHIGQLVMDGKGMIWASSFTQLDCINPYTMKVHHMPNEGSINYLMASGNGNVWVGNNTGVKCYMANMPMKGAEMNSKEWNIGEKVASMCDVEGKIWIVTGDECCVLDLEGNSFRYIVPVVRPQNIFYSKMDKVVMMGGNDGYVTMRADLTIPKAEKAKLLLAGIVVNGQQTQEALLDENIKETPGISPADLKTLVLQYEEHNFTLQLSDLPFANHPTSVYAYKLEGSDRDWRYLNKGNLDISYNGLSYGDYHLTVHLVNGEGQIGEEVYSLDISVLPPWYLSIWCKIFYFTILVVFISWVINSHFVSKQLKEAEKQKAEILEQVKDRMAFYANLAEKLKEAVAHRSFEEVSHLVSSTLEVDGEFDEEILPLMSAEQEKGAEPEVELDELDKKLLTQITHAIEENMVNSDFNVTMLQETMGMGSKQLYRKVKALTGKTPVEYIRDMRLRKAAKLLKAGKFSVSEVMYTVGFSNSSYFSKCFSKAFGMTPTEYIKKM